MRQEDGIPAFGPWRFGLRRLWMGGLRGTLMTVRDIKWCLLGRGTS